MASEMPYMPSVTNVPAIFDRIREAGTPPRFTHDFLKSTLGFGSSNDRAIVKVLRSLGFLSSDGAPTPRYNEFKGTSGNKVLAQGLRDGWSGLFMADQKIYEKPVSDVQSVVKSVTGSGDAVARKIATTFKSLSEKADWTNQVESAPEASETNNEESNGSSPLPSPESVVEGGLRLHHDVHIHLPPTSDVSVYRAIFQAMKSELM